MENGWNNLSDQVEQAADFDDLANYVASQGGDKYVS